MKTAHWNRLRHLSLLAAATALCGCSTTYEFTVDAITATHGIGQFTSFHLADVTPDAVKDVVPFERVATDVKTALSGRGLFEAPDDLPPSMTVTIEYGFESPRVVTRKESEITYMPDTYIPQDATAMSGPPVPPSGPALAKPRTVYITEIVQPKYLRLAAFESSEDATGQTLWRVEVKNEDRSVDLGHYLRLMAAVAMDYVGNNSAAGEPVSMAENDRRVQFIERGT